MPKTGLRSDYDLLANREPTARNQKCVVCEAEPVVYQWSDYSGEAMCARCGTPYQLKWGSERQQAEGAYPYLRLKPEWVPVVRRYFEETGKNAMLGMFLPPHPSEKVAFFQWVEQNDAAPAEDSARPVGEGEG